MKASIAVAALLASTSPLAAQSLPAPIAQAAAGRLQCYVPDTARKTCNALAAYKPAPNGAIANTAIVLISKNPAVTMETLSRVEIKAGQVCGKMRPEDMDTAKFTVGGQPLTGPQAASMRQQMKDGYKELFGREICTTYIPDGTAFIAKATMDGNPMAGDQRVIWVSPNEGYRVSP